MVRQRSGIIGVVTGRLDSPFIALALEQLSHRLQQQGLKTLIYSGSLPRRPLSPRFWR